MKAAAARPHSKALRAGCEGIGGAVEYPFWSSGMTTKKLSRESVLVTGAGGFIGSHLCERCLNEGAYVRAFVHYNSRNDWGMLEDLAPEMQREIEIIAGDLRDFDAVRHAVRGCKVVFHLGALIGIPYSFAHPADVVTTNVIGTLHVLQACLEFSVDRLVQTSTSEVYGTASYVPMDEAHPLKPQSPYAASKVGGDKLAESYFRAYNLPVTILRPFNTYGPRQSARAVIPTIIQQALQSTVIRLGSLEPRRDLTYVTDTVRGFVAAAISERANGQTVQLGSQSEISVAELVALIGKLLGKRLRVVQEARRKRPHKSEVQRLFASNQKARKLLGWRPLVPLADGLAWTIRWFQDGGQSRKSDIYHI
jgi:NAD dependent epimerase/dehydratase